MMKPIIRQKPEVFAQNEPVKHKLLVVITNHGFANEVVAVSRLTGATGGTILTGRGAMREEAKTFLGVDVTDEKEIVLIVVEEDNLGAILGAIKEKAGRASAAQGITFSLPVGDFAMLSDILKSE